MSLGPHCAGGALFVASTSVTAFRFSSRAPFRGQAGQAAVEYAGVVLAVAAVALALLTAAPGVGQTIVCKVTVAIESVGGGGGGCGGDGQDGRPPAPPYLVSESQDQTRLSVTAFSIKGGGEVLVRQQRMSDGDVLVRVSGLGEVGAEGGIGGGVNVEGGSASTGGGAKAKVGVSLLAGGGATWRFDSQEEADEFLEILRNEARDKAVESAVPLLGRAATAVFGEDRPLPEPESYFVEGGPQGKAKADAGGLAGYGGAGIEGRALLGVEENPGADERTLFLRPSASGDVNASALLQGVSGRLGGSGYYAVTVDAETGDPKRLTLIGEGTGSGNAPAFVNGRVKPADFLKTVKLTGQPQSGRRLRYEAQLPLETPADRRAVQQFLSDPSGSAPVLAQRFSESGSFTAGWYEADRDAYGGEASGAFGIKFGVEGQYEGTETDALRIWQWTPDRGMRSFEP